MLALTKAAGRGEPSACRKSVMTGPVDQIGNCHRARSPTIPRNANRQTLCTVPHILKRRRLLCVPESSAISTFQIPSFRRFTASDITTQSAERRGATQRSCTYFPLCALCSLWFLIYFRTTQSDRKLSGCYIALSVSLLFFNPATKRKSFLPQSTDSARQHFLGTSLRLGVLCVFNFLELPRV